MDMTNRQRRDTGMAYISDDTIFEEQHVCKKILQKLNFWGGWNLRMRRTNKYVCRLSYAYGI